MSLLRHNDCTCPIGLHPNDPDNFWCAQCERRMDEDAEREAAEAFEEFHALAFEADHETPNYYKPGKPDQIICVPCHRAKTREQQPEINRTKRLNGEFKSQYDRRQERKAKGLPPLLQGQGFGTRSRRTRQQIMDGANANSGSVR